METKSKAGLGFKGHALIIFSLIVVVVAGSTIANHCVPHGAMEAIAAAKDSLDHYGLKKAWGELVASQPGNIDYHHDYLGAHFDIPQTIVISSRYNSRTIIRDDQAIVDQYQSYVLSADPHMRDIGYYGLGYIYSNLEKPQLALDNLSKVSDPKLPYLNNTLGNIYWRNLNNVDKAVDYFNQEIAVKGNISAAVHNLSKVYWDRNDRMKINTLRQDPALGSYVPLRYERYEDLRQGKALAYLGDMFRAEVNEATLVGVLSSLAIAVVFLGYFYFVDVFDDQKTGHFILAFGLGLLTAPLSSVFYDLGYCFASVQQTGDNWKDLFYYIFGVGLFEETAKLLPVLVIVFLLRLWKEPADILIFASLSGLGFATVENINYIGGEAIGHMVPRTLSSVVMHVSLTTLAAYGFFYARRRANHWGLVPLVCFGAAVLAHGLYDYFIQTDFWGYGGYISLFMVLYFMAIYQRMIQSGLDQSPEAGALTKNIHLSLYLFYGFLAIFLMQFAILNTRYGLGTAGWSLFMTLLGSTLLLCYFLTSFGQIKVIKGKWYSFWDKNWLSKT